MANVLKWLQSCWHQSVAAKFGHCLEGVPTSENDLLGTRADGKFHISGSITGLFWLGQPD